MPDMEQIRDLREKSIELLSERLEEISGDADLLLTSEIAMEALTDSVGSGWTWTITRQDAALVVSARRGEMRDAIGSQVGDIHEGLALAILQVYTGLLDAWLQQSLEHGPKVQ